MGSIPADPPPVPAPDPAAAAAWHAAADQLADWAFKALVVRSDRYGGYRLADGALQKQTKPPKGPQRGALSKDVLRTHFRATTGEHVVGVHSLTAADDGDPSSGKWVGVDWDNHGKLDQVAARNLTHAVHAYRRLAALGFRPLLCTWGTGGYHLWVPLAGKVPGPALRAFGNWIVADSPEFGFYAQQQGDAASGFPESNPKQSTVKAGGYGNWLRLPGRHHKLDVWAVVFDGERWVQGAEAVEFVLALPRQDAALIPAAAAPSVDKPSGRASKQNAAGPVLKVVGGQGDVFETYNRLLTLADVVALHEQAGGHTVTTRTADRVDFRREGKDGGGDSFNVKLVGGAAVTFNFSTGAALPANDGLSPSEVRCFYECGRCDTGAMKAFAQVLRRELGLTVRAEPERSAAAPAADGLASRITDGGYTVQFGATYHCRLDRNRETGELTVRDQTKLANFAARITGETVTDDGAEQTREFTLAVEHQRRPTATVAVPVEKFAALDWVVERLGVAYVVRAGRGTRDQLRAAIQELSGDDVPTASTYAHTGWREVGGRWVYLHAAGAVGGSAGVSVRLTGAATGYALPEPPVGRELVAAVRASLGILDGLAPDEIVFPLLAATYRAVLGPSDFALWLAGQTGAQKSELAALSQQHYGATMNRTRLPGNWSSTDNALEGLAFTLKDSVLVIDDFAPPSARADADRLQRTADRLIRGAGNSAGRQRMRADGTLRPEKPPRCLVVGTGEDVPRGHSIGARLFVLDVRRGCVSLPRLSDCQRDAAAGRYAGAMAGFLAHLAPQYAAVRAGLDAERAEIRDLFVGRFPHARTPDVVANLLVGLRRFLTFAETVGAVTAAERAALWQRGQTAFRAVADEQGENQREADPIARFAAQLASLVSSRAGHFATPDGTEPFAPPLSPEGWGWEGREFRSGADETRVDWSSRGQRLGWVRDGVLYLEPDTVYAGLVELSRKQGQSYPLTQLTLFRRLKEVGEVVGTDGTHNTRKVTLEGNRKRVVPVRVEFIFPTADPVPQFSRNDAPVEDGEVGREYGANYLQKPGFAPTAPVAPVSGRREESGTPDDLFAAYDRIAH